MLELYFLPLYSPELDPTELVWNQAQNHQLGHEVITSKEQLKTRVISVLRSISKCTVTPKRPPKLRFCDLLGTSQRHSGDRYRKLQ
jgi:transposase